MAVCRGYLEYSGCQEGDTDVPGGRKKKPDVLSRTQWQGQGLETFTSPQPPPPQLLWVSEDPALSEGNAHPLPTGDAVNQ